MVISRLGDWEQTGSLPQQKEDDEEEEEEEEEVTHVQFVLSIYSPEHGQTSRASPLKKTEYFPTCIPHLKSLAVQSYTSLSLTQFVRVLFDGFLSRLLLLVGRGR